MKKFITLIGFIFIFIFGCTVASADAVATLDGINLQSINNPNGTIEWINDFEIISKEIEHGNYVLASNNNLNITGAKDNPDEHMLSFSSKNETYNNFYTTNLSRKNKQQIEHKSFILETNPRGP